MATNKSKNAETVEDQAAQQAGKSKVRLRVDQRDVDSTYANAFRPVASTEELMLDFGINQTFPLNEAGDDAPNAEIVFDVSSRIIMNFYTAKRLTLALNQVVAKFENEFGEIKLSAADRRK